MDRLQQIFHIQAKLQYKYLSKKGISIKLPSLQPDEIPEQVTGLIAELGEILQAYQGWKGWRSELPIPNPDEVLEEYVDALKFLINIGLYLGFDADEVYEQFIRKDNINHDRLDQIGGS